MLAERECPECHQMIGLYNHGNGIRFVFHHKPDGQQCPNGDKIIDPGPSRPVSNEPPINLWAGFLSHEKLTPDRVGEENVMVLVDLCQELGVIQSDCVFFRSHKDRIAARRLVVNTAMSMGIDLPAIKHKGKTAMGRGLLDVWNAEYAKRFGSAVGTGSVLEAKRRDVKTRLANEIRQERDQQGTFGDNQ